MVAPTIKNSFNHKKFKQILHYVINSSCHAPNVGKTVLYKILYFAEFDFYELYERKLTGERYFRLEHGPAPSHFDSVLVELESEEKISQFTTSFHGYPQKRCVSNAQKRCVSNGEPEITLLSAEELKHIDITLAKYSNMTATQVSALSHIDLPWMATEPNGEIDYELVFYRDPQTSVREYEQPASP